MQLFSFNFSNSLAKILLFSRIRSIFASFSKENNENEQKLLQFWAVKVDKMEIVASKIGLDVSRLIKVKKSGNKKSE